MELNFLVWGPSGGGVVWVECVQICGLHAVVLGGNAEARLRS
jgi:hypothetical protein